MAATYVGVVASVGRTNTTDSYSTAAITSAVAAGDKIIITVWCEGSRTVLSVTGNGCTFVEDFQDSVNASNNETIAVFSADAPAGGVAVSSFFTVTLSDATGNRHGAITEVVSGLEAGGASAVSADGATGTSSHPIANAVTAGAGDFVLGVAGITQSTDGTWTLGNGFTLGDDQHAGTTFVRSAVTGHKISAGASETFDAPTSSSAGSWVAGTIVYAVAATGTAYTDAPSGTETATGSIVEVHEHDSAPSGTVTPSGSIIEAYTPPGPTGEAGLVAVSLPGDGRPWRVVIGDIYGNTISNVTPIAYSKSITAALNKPAALTFKVPSNDKRVAGLHTDDRPFVAEGRTVRAYRQEAGVWVCRFAGWLWQISDEGDEEQAWTTCVCFDPLIQLNRRIVRLMQWDDSDAVNVNNWRFELRVPGFTGGDYQDAAAVRTFPLISVTDDHKAFDAAPATMPATDVARGLLMATNRFDGFTGMLSPYYDTYADRTGVVAGDPATGGADGVDGLYPTGYDAGDEADPAIVRPPASSPDVSPTYDYKKVGDALTDLVAMGDGFDLEVRPLDVGDTEYVSYTSGGSAPEYPSTDDDGVPNFYPRMGVFQVLAKLYFHVATRGTDKPNAVFAWGCGDHSASKISRAVDLENLITNAYAVGAAGIGSALDQDAIDAIGFVGMDSVSASDVTDQAQLDAMAAGSLVLGGNAQPAYSVTPTPGRCPMPWDDFDLGDTVRLVAGEALRGGFSYSPRVYGFTVDIGDDGGEVLSQVVTSPGV